MPILVVGADHPLGEAIVNELVEPDREVRAFVSDPEVASRLRAVGAKVAVGDVSDEGHISAAATNCFSIAFVEAAITDGRDVAFLHPDEVPAAWAGAAVLARVTRAIWVGPNPPPLATNEQIAIDTEDPSIVPGEVARLDELERL